MKTREIAELNILIQLLGTIKGPALTKDGRRIVSTEDGNTFNFDYIEHRTKELLSKFLEPYKIKN